MVEFSAKKVSEACKEGFDRLTHFRKMRAAFIKDYLHQYALQEWGLSGEKPINLVFLTIRTLIPNLILKNPLNKVTTKILPYKEYAEILGLGLNELQEQLRMKSILRGAASEMCFSGLAVLKTGIAAEGMSMMIGPDMDVDPGQIYTELISGDDFVFDPMARALDRATFLGHRVRVPKQELLDADGWDHDMVMALPTIESKPKGQDRAEDISKGGSQAQQMQELQNYVEIVELYFPKAEAIAYIPDPYQIQFDEFLKIQDYYGPRGGGYSFGSLTPPIPDNPLPVAPVGVWRDIADMTNNLFKKLMDKADRQKDVLFYAPAMADVADAVKEARDGEAIACTDPSQIRIESFGGTKDLQVEQMVGSLNYWWNLLSGNPMQMGGLSGSTQSETATEFQGLQGNLSVGLNDMRDMVYDLAGAVSSDQAWFMIYDPLIEMPLYKRTSGGDDVQVWLTPEQRRGEWQNYTFDIVKRSMQVMDPLLRAKNIMSFYTNVLPSVASAAIQMMQMGIAFDVSRALMQAAEELGISDSLSEVFNDPTFQQRMQIYMQMGPQKEGKGMMNPTAVGQNKGFPGQRPIASPMQEQRQVAQESAGMVQSAMRG